MNMETCPRGPMWWALYGGEKGCVDCPNPCWEALFGQIGDESEDN